MRRAVIAAAVLALTLGAQAPAEAAVETDWPEIVYPLAPKPADRGAINVHIEAPRHAWGIRIAASNWDDRLPGVRITTRGTCDRHPRAVCVHVTIRDFGWTSWRGRTTVDTTPSSDDREIQLNQRGRPGPFRGRLHIASHELGHIIGLGHHDSGFGILSYGHWKLRRFATWTEIRAANRYYGAP